MSKYFAEPHSRLWRYAAARALLLISAFAAAASTAAAQQQGGHDMGDMMAGPLGVSHVRMGSGTSWMPDSSPMHANHKMFGDWTAMLHGVAFGQYDDQGSDRGDKQLGIVDWEMLMAMRKIGSGMLHLHAMASLEPATIGAKGYPLLLQTGESYQGQPLHDRQHPHDAIMELAAMFQQPVAKDLAIELYGGPAGEPALGPVAFMHRPSAQNDPLAPLAHHWQDATHISYGVATVGLYSRIFKLEGSWFNGREPDENRWDIDLRKFDSYSGRLTVNPTGRWSFSGWYGYLPSPEALHPNEQVHRYGASALYGARGIGGGSWASSLIWGANAHAGLTQNSVTAETNLEIGEKNAVFARAEYVRKSAEDLVLPSFAPDRQLDINSLVGGYVREVASIRGGSIGIGGRGSINFIPRALEPFYGTRTPAGIDVYVRVRPNRMTTESMGGMSMPAMHDMTHDMTHEMSHDSSASRMPPGMKMPGMEPHPPGHEMPGMQMPDSARTRRDSAAAKPAMPGMPGMHDMRNMPGMPGMKDMPGMRHDSASTKQAPAMTPKSRAGSSTAATAPGKKSSTRATKPGAKKSAKKSAKPSAAKKPATRAKPKAAPHAMPGMQNMPGMKPGMKMPTDSTRPRKP